MSIQNLKITVFASTESSRKFLKLANYDRYTKENDYKINYYLDNCDIPRYNAFKKSLQNFSENNGSLIMVNPLGNSVNAIVVYSHGEQHSYLTEYGAPLISDYCVNHRRENRFKASVLLKYLHRYSSVYTSK